jgi:hypothetical protein
MKALAIGLAAALAVAASATSALAAKTDIPAEARKAGMAAAPTLVQAAHLNCNVSDAWKFGEGNSKEGGKQTFYEVACQDAMGYVIISDSKKPTPDYVDCLQADEPQNGKQSNIFCKLPGNANPAAGLQPLVAASGHTCPIDKARVVGGNDQLEVYEVTCQGGAGYILTSHKDTKKVTAQLCAVFGPSSNISCKLSTQAQQDAAVDALASAAPKPCQVKARRYVGSVPDGSADFFEVACANNSGYVLQVDPTGKVAQAIDCVKAAGFAGGCTLTDTRQAQTEQNAVYTDLAKKAGFNCDVSKYADFPNREDGAEVVELACTNRPDGGIGIFPPKGQPQVLDCLRAGDDGYGCTFSDVKPLLPKMSAVLAAKGKGSCAVSDARPYGAKTGAGAYLVEVACSDGGPGWVIELAPTSDTAVDLLNCAQAAKLGGGGCQLPSNKKG